MYGVKSNTLSWLSSYLTTRRQRVVLNGSYSEWLPVTSGVPQGSTVGPLLFLMYINDLPACVKHSKVALFADDTKLYNQIHNRSDCENLQNDFNELIEWAKAWKINFK